MIHVWDPLEHLGGKEYYTIHGNDEAIKNHLCKYFSLTDKAKFNIPEEEYQTSSITDGIQFS